MNDQKNAMSLYLHNEKKEAIYFYVYKRITEVTPEISSYKESKYIRLPYKFLLIGLECERRK